MICNIRESKKWFVIYVVDQVDVGRAVLSRLKHSSLKKANGCPVQRLFQSFCVYLYTFFLVSANTFNVRRYLIKSVLSDRNLFFAKLSTDTTGPRGRQTAQYSSYGVCISFVKNTILFFSCIWSVSFRWRSLMFVGPK